VLVTPGEAVDAEPALVAPAGGDRLLLFRSDRNVALSRLGGGIPGVDASDASRRAGDEASVRRFAGTTTVSLSDLDRNRERGRFGDLLTYTPQKPGGAREPALGPDELYTRGTIGLYVERQAAGPPLTAAGAERLRELLQRLLPANMRAVIILQPSGLLLESVFPSPHPLADAYMDDYPFIEDVGGVGETTRAALPDWHQLLASRTTSVTVDPRDLTSLRGRTWRPPPE
jgi:hypothetical protein